MKKPKKRTYLNVFATFFALTIIMGGLYIFVAASHASLDYEGPVMLPTKPSDTWPSWSPDGKSILFQSNRKPDGGVGFSTSTIYKVSSYGGTITHIMDYYDIAYPAWSPDGKRIAFQAGAQIYVYTISDKSRNKITLNERDGDQSSWSADSNYVFFRSERGDTNMDIYKARYDANPAKAGSHKRVIILKGTDSLPVCSPDGTKLLFLHKSPTGAINVMVANADGSNPHVVFSHNREIDRLSWFPDNDRILIQLEDIDPDDGCILRIVRESTRIVTPLVFSSNHQIWKCTDAVISPDGKKIAFSATPSGSDGDCIYICNLDGSNLKQVTKAP